MTWPPAWDPAADAQPAAASHAPAARGYPPTGWPTRDQLDYTKAAITALLLVLALPWLSYKLVTQPSEVLAGAARQHIGGR